LPRTTSAERLKAATLRPGRRVLILMATLTLLGSTMALTIARRPTAAVLRVMVGKRVGGGATEFAQGY